MKEVYLLRHGEKDATGMLTEYGKQSAKAMSNTLPDFVSVFSSGSNRTKLTAKLLTGQDPFVDQRAGYSTSAAEVSHAISVLARERDISFLDAAREYNDQELLKDIDEQAHALNAMIDELLSKLREDEKALVISHDLTIAPAMGFRGMSAESIEPLSGYVISMGDGEPLVRHY